MKLPLFRLHAVLCPGIVMLLPAISVTATGRNTATHRDGLRRLEQGDPRRIEAGAAPSLAVAGVGARAEHPRGQPLRRRSRFRWRTGRFALEDVDVASAPYLVGTVTGLDDEVGDEDTAESASAAAVARFVEYLELLRAREARTAMCSSIRVELETRDTPGKTSTRIWSRASGLEEVEQTLEPRLLIPDDPTTLSYLSSGITQVELPRRQALLEAETTVERLVHLLGLLDREILLLRRRLRLFTPDMSSRAG